MNNKHFLLTLLLFSFVTTWAQDAKTYQENLNAQYLDPTHSPLSADDLKAFRGLEFFPISQEYEVTAEFVRTPLESVFGMATSSGEQKLFVKYGELHFQLKGRDFQLNVYQSQNLKNQEAYADYLFLPFTDLSNGKSTYAGGRYLDLRIPKSNTVHLDFNKAYNPYCAYSGGYSCPIPPKENHLALEVKAGVKAFH